MVVSLIIMAYSHQQTAIGRVSSVLPWKETLPKDLHYNSYFGKFFLMGAGVDSLIDGLHFFVMP